MVRRGAADLLVLDLGLPDMDGLDVVKRIRESGAALPIIILPSREKENAKVTALDLGADDYVTKPFGIDELLARIPHGGAASAAAGRRKATAPCQEEAGDFPSPPAVFSPLLTPLIWSARFVHGSGDDGGSGGVMASLCPAGGQV
jgi:DNA-binding NtrC family response regulator